MDEMEQRTQQAHRCCRRRGESSPPCVVCVCGMRAVGRRITAALCHAFG